MITAGRITTAEYIRPSRYTPDSRAATRLDTGTGMDSSRSLSLGRYSPA